MIGDAVMIKKEMGKAVLSILYAANEIWVTVGDIGIDNIVELLRCATMLCNLYDLRENEQVENFKGVIIAEYKERKAEVVARELTERFNKGFIEKE